MAEQHVALQNNGMLLASFLLRQLYLISHGLLG